MTGALRSLARRFAGAGAESARIHGAVLRLISGLRPDPMLDVGCGSGAKAAAYAEAMGVPPGGLFGIEAQENYIREAAARLQVRALDIEKDAFPFPDEYFDLVVCNQVLEHLKNIYLPLQQMDRVVKTGGHLLIGVPNLAGLYNRMLLAAGRQPLAVAIAGPHVRGFSCRDMREFLELNGNFRLEASGGANLYPLPAVLSDHFVGRLPGLSAFSFFLLRKVRHSPADCAWRPGPCGDTCF